MKTLLASCALFTALTFFPNISVAEKNESSMKLYRLDCGDIHVSDLNVFSDSDQYIGQSKDLVVSCYVIRKGGMILLWDTGLNSSIAEKKDGVTSGPFTLTLKETITAQLAKINLTPDDITHVGLSHSHFDHAGNVNLFKNAQLIIQKAEYDTLVNTPDVANAHNMNTSQMDFFLKEENKEQLEIISGDQNLLSDGSLKAISLPGHTPGHMALKVTLSKSGVVILSGDQWHFDANHLYDEVPSFNYDRADTISSSDKLNRLVANNNATLIIQHEPKDTETLPALPAYLE